VIDGRHPHDAALHHVLQRLIVHIRAVLDGVRAGANGIAHAAGAVRVNRDLLAGGMSRVDDVLHFVERHGLRAVDDFISCRASRRP
jgi:hypothetical protein